MSRIADVLEREGRTVDLEQGDFERLLGRRERKHRNQRIRAGALGVIVALAVGIALVRSLTSDGIPMDEPTPAPAPGISGALAYGLDGDIYLADPDGTNAVKITDGGIPGIPDEGCAGTVGYETPSWSPDGRYLAFQRVCSYSSSTDPVAVVISDPEGAVVAEIPASGYGWSPDSTRLAVWGDFQRTVDVYGVDGVRQASLPWPIVGTPAENAPEWMPDGSALLVRGASPVSLMALPLDGSPRTSSRASCRAPRRTGTRIAVPADHSTVITNADGARVSEVDMRLGDFQLGWSPDGQLIAALSRRGDLVVIDVATGTMTVLNEAMAVLSEGDSINVIRGFSPQGDRILYAALVRGSEGGVYNSLYSIGVDGSDARLLVDGAMQGQWRPR